MAATVIQDAVDAADDGDLILVTNGVYKTGGRVLFADTGNKKWNRVAITKPVSVMSVNGPSVTIILGDVAPNHRPYGTRCAYVTNNALLAGFTLSSGGNIHGNFNEASRDNTGGGILAESSSAVISNCVVTANIGCWYGGGVYGGTLINCLIEGNTAQQDGKGGQGGGAYNSVLLNCTVAGNWASIGGGVGWCTISNSIVYANVSHPFAQSNYLNGTFVNSCASPLPTGTGNISDDPLFVNFSEGNFRLQSNSPCIDAGDNSAVTSTGDLEGSPRILNGVVDMGAFELQHLPVVVLHPQNQSVLIHSNVTFTALAVGDAPLVYRWQKDETDLTDDSRISGTATPSLSISNLVVADAGKYRVIVTNLLGEAISAEATLKILGPPSISTQPTNRIVPAGTNASFSVVASGLTTLSYQWRFENALLLNATNSSLVLTNVQSADAGDYDVVISNSYGMITSAVATLTVEPSLPTITRQPISRVASLQQPVTFTVTAKGTQPIHCQWQKNGTNLPGATNFTLNFPGAQTDDAGLYRAVLSNSVDVVFSDEATLSIVPIIVWARTNFNALQIPASATNVVAMSANFDMLFALRADGTAIGWGRTNAPVDATNLVAIAALNSQQVLPSSPNVIGVDPEGTIRTWGPAVAVVTNVPAHATNVVAVAAGSSHALALRGDGSVVAWGTGAETNVSTAATNVVAIAAGPTVSLALRADGTVVSWGSNRSKQQNVLSNAMNVVSIAAGGNQIAGLDENGTVLGYIATNGGPPGVFYGHPPEDATNVTEFAVGNSHSLGLRPDGSVVGWGANTFSGVTNIPSYATNVVGIGAGGYHSFALVRDSSTPIPPRIGREPMSRNVSIGKTIVVHSLALGAMPLSYQWSFEDELLPEQTNSWLVLTNVQLSQSGNYQLVVSNNFGSVTSVVSTVTVTAPPPTIVNPVFDENELSFSVFAYDGVEYVLEFKEQLSQVEWQVLQEFIGSGATVTLTDSTTLDVSRFYRVRVK